MSDYLYNMVQDNRVQDLMKEIFKPYFEAASKILKGTPVDKLDDIMQQCNKAYLTKSAPDVKAQAGMNYPLGYYPLDLVVSFAADAENNILNGTDPVEAYSGKGLEPLNLRKRCRKVLEREVQYYLGNA